MSTFVLMHGGLHTPDTWSLLVPELESYGHRAVTVDLPMQEPGVTLDELISVAARTIETVEGPVILVSHSLSGATALGLAGSVPLTGLVLLNSAIFFSETAAPDQPTPMLYLEEDDLIPAPDMTVTVGREVCREKLYHDLESEMFERAFSKLRAHATSANEGPTAIPHPSIPCVYIRAEDDRMVTAEWSEWAAHEITGRAAIVMPGSHSPFYAQPRELATLLESLRQEFEAPEVVSSTK